MRQLPSRLFSCHDNKAFYSFIPDNTSGLWNSQNRPAVRFWRYCSISSRRTAKGNKSGVSLSPLCPRYHKVQFFIPKINCRQCGMEHRRTATFIKCWGKLIKSQTWRKKDASYLNGHVWPLYFRCTFRELTSFKPQAPPGLKRPLQAKGLNTPFNHRWPPKQFSRGVIVYFNGT